MEKVTLSQAKEIKKSLLACINECYPDQQTDISIKEVTPKCIVFSENNTVMIVMQITVESINQKYESYHFQPKFSELNDWIEKIKALAKTKTPFKYAKDDLLIIVDEDEKTYEYCKVLDRTRELKFKSGYVEIDTLCNCNFYKVHCFNGVEKNISESQLFQYRSL